MRNILEVKDLSEIEWHACSTGCTGWRPIAKSEWPAHVNDQCDKCKGKRFKTKAGRLAPSRVSGENFAMRLIHIVPSHPHSLLLRLVVPNAQACMHAQPQSTGLTVLV